MTISKKFKFPISSLALLILFLISCNDRKSDKTRGNTTTFVVDENKNITITVPDSVMIFELEDAKAKIKNYFDNTERFDIDTISTLSTTSIALDGKARELQKKLMAILPKVSLTTGTGENKFTRKYYIIEGDIKVDRDELYYYCLKRFQRLDTNVNYKIKSRKLTIATDKSGNPSIWPSGTIVKYCIMRSSFSYKSLYDTVVKAMSNATNDWMQACNIRFQYVPNLDNSDIDLESYPDQILFIVRQLNVNGEFIAQSFFPSDPQFNRMLLLDNTFFTSSFNKTGVLRHELGHILGFRHEHIWSDDASCSGEEIIEKEVGAKPVTKYDPYSVMHYPCGQNKDNRIIELTDFDKVGARKVYPFNN